MPDNSKRFHEFALQSILFKGRADWYFCYLKCEKLAHVLLHIGQLSAPNHRDEVRVVGERGSLLSGEIAHLAAGEVDAAVVLADLFSVLSGLRTLVVQGHLGKENGLLLIREYEAVAERLVRGSHPSPFVASDELQVSLPEPSPLLESRPLSYKDTDRTLIKDKTHKGQNKGQTDRMSLILELVRKKKKLSIKDIAAEIKGCSEKTIQRELGTLIAQGLVRKIGERRWSLYLPA